MQEAPRTREEALEVVVEGLNADATLSEVAIEWLGNDLAEMGNDTASDCSNGRLYDVIEGAKSLVVVCEAIQTLMEWDASKTISGFVPDMVLECIAETFDNMKEEDES